MRSQTTITAGIRSNGFARITITTVVVSPGTHKGIFSGSDIPDRTLIEEKNRITTGNETIAISSSKRIRRQKKYRPILNS
ncbi:MAG: hypothetical protein JXA82_06570 [Sedimentisphaerales bacterium]|nr:hypothetical protein [Sedimentisphaerales bacterium]